ncbi:hypothetical protein MTBPR1_80172 [Candidatus Terasakiella magnetica]|uniref:Uncharacterized protein n=1 Tax=Candidatus Terasakiella magnetica TaxID=1867952 RepID=A0A1C3RLJ8_9PROT|nr:hypothetical protein [Candidatus Terasakiella magnetica]SCA58118.1 hypothetical protein MTBPR1_80172 [Candidatus Terasakiella magnetica]
MKIAFNVHAVDLGICTLSGKGDTGDVKAALQAAQIAATFKKRYTDLLKRIDDASGAGIMTAEEHQEAMEWLGEAGGN